MPTFRLEWWWAGHRGVIENVGARWSARGYALIGRNVESVRKVTIQAVLPLDVASLAARYGLRSGAARLTCEDRPLLTGKMRIAHGVPRDGSTPVEIEVSDDERREVGVFPPSGTAPRERSPDDVVGYENWLVYTGPEWDGLPYWARRVPANGGQQTFTRRIQSVTVPVLRSNSTTDFSGIPAPSEGQSLPYIIGAPGTATAPGSPAWLIFEGTADARLVIADRAVDVATVTIFGPTDSANPTNIAPFSGVPVGTATLDDGGTYSYVLMSDVVASPSTIVAYAEGHYYASWTDGEASSGLAGDVALAVIASSSLVFDLDAWLAVVPRLNVYRFDGFLDEQTPSWDWFKAALLPMLPIAVVGGPRGLRPLLAPWIDGLATDGVPLVDGAGVTLADFVREREASGASAVTIEYGYRPDSDGYEYSFQADGSNTPIVGTDVGVDSIQTAFVWDAATAQAFARDALRLRANRNRYVRLDVGDLAMYGPGGEHELYEGRLVSLTSDAVGGSTVVGAVSEIEIDGDGMIVAVDLRDDPTRGD